jgi:hypothetical protein
VQPHLGLYIRPARNDHVVLQQLIVEGRAPTGFVFEARFGSRHEVLWQAAIDANLDAVLDTNAQEMWTPHGEHLGGLQETRWAFAVTAGEPQLRGEVGNALTAQIAAEVSEKGFTSVLAPTHYLSGPDDTWLEVDLSLSRPGCVSSWTSVG